MLKSGSRDMENKILFLDLDDTLLDHSKEISPENRKALWDCSGKGIKIGYVTSRADRKLKKLLKDVPCDFMCSLNGAHIQIMEAGKILWEEYNGFSWHEGMEILKRCRDLPQLTLCAYFYPYSIFGEEIFLKDEKLGLVDEYLPSVSPVRFQRIRLYQTEKDSVSSWESENVRLYSEKEDVLMEADCIDKGTAVKSVLDFYGLTSEDAAAFGDGEQDISMFEACGCRVAMRNASDELMGIATEVTDDCEHSGVAKWIRINLCPELPKHIHSSLSEEDGIYLLKDLRGIKQPVSAEEKRRLLQKGVPGQQILAMDPPVNKEKIELFQELTDKNRHRIAKYVGILAETILEKKGELPVLVSLARGGIIYGAACKRYYKKYYQANVPHYVISFVRELGIDENALDYIIKQHGDSRIQFIDGWTGSGYVSNQLKLYVDDYNERHHTRVCSDLAVLADTSHLCQISGTREDIMLPDCCLNATICGLLSGICVDADSVEKKDFHGAIIFHELKEQDFSSYYLDSIMSAFQKQTAKTEHCFQNYGKQMGEKIRELYGIRKVSSVRLGIGETTRAMFRRNVKCILVKDPTDERIDFLAEMAREKQVPLIQADLGDYISTAILVEEENA